MPVGYTYYIILKNSVSSINHKSTNIYVTKTNKNVTEEEQSEVIKKYRLFTYLRKWF